MAGEQTKGGQSVRPERSPWLRARLAREVPYPQHGQTATAAQTPLRMHARTSRWSAIAEYVSSSEVAFIALTPTSLDPLAGPCFGEDPVAGPVGDSCVVFASSPAAGENSLKPPLVQPFLVRHGGCTERIVLKTVSSKPNEGSSMFFNGIKGNVFKQKSNGFARGSLISSSGPKAICARSRHVSPARA